MLKSIPGSSEFWIAAHHGLQPLEPYPVAFALRDPYQHGPGVPEGTFAKILAGMMSGTLSEVDTVNAISAFSNYTTKEEWESWYKPVLEKRLYLPVTLTEFNKACPKEFRVTGNPVLAPLTPVAAHLREGGKLPTRLFVEPYNDAPRLLVYFREMETYVFLEDGTPVHRMLPKVFDRVRNPEGVMVELYEDEDQLIVRDILLWNQFTEEEDSPPLHVRLKILRDMFSNQDEVEVVEHFSHDHDTSPREDIALCFQSGYPGVVLRDAWGLYHDTATSILIHPKRKSVLTCTRMTAGAEDSKYAGRTEMLWGKGRMDRKQFDTPVFHGLTFDDRETIFVEKDEYLGKRFEIISCGLDPGMQLILPIFVKWKE